MNTDPTAAYRAGQRFDVDTIVGAPASPADLITVKTINDNNLQIGDTVIIGGTVNFNGEGLVSSIVDRKTFTVTATTVAYASETVGAVYLNQDVNGTGVDALEVNTVASGKASKYFEYITLSNAGATSNYTLEGKIIDVNMPDGSNVEFEFVEDVVTNGKTPVSIVFSTFEGTNVDATNHTIEIENPEDFNVGDLVQIHIPSSATFASITSFADYIVSSISGKKITLNDTASDAVEIGAATSTTASFRIINLTGTLENLKAAMITADTSGLLNGTPVRAIFNGVADVNTTNNSITVNDASKFDVGDIVLFSDICGVRGNAVKLPADVVTPTAMVAGTYAKVATIVRLSNGRGTLTFNYYDVEAQVTTGALQFFATSDVTNAFTQNISALTNATEEFTVADASKFKVGDKVLATIDGGTYGSGSLDTGVTYTVSASDKATNKIKLDGVLIGVSDAVGGSGVEDTFTNITANTESNFRITNLTKSKGGTIAVDTGKNGKQLNYIGVYGLRYTEAVQGTSFFDDTNSTPCLVANMATDQAFLEETDTGIIIDSAVGRTFESLGLATKQYIDTDFDGRKEAHFTLTSDGEVIARLYIFVKYTFNGQVFEFNGTIVPFPLNDRNLYIQDSADNVAIGWKLVLNDNTGVQASIADPRFRFSSSVNSGLIEDNFTGVAFNAEDPAVLNDAIWEYDPNLSFNTTAISAAWELFLDKDVSSSDMLVSAGTAITNLFARSFEQINFTVMNKMLDICEKRKDRFCIFDGVDESRIDAALEKMGTVGGEGDLSRWGAIFDGRSIFFDNIYTQLNVDLVKSIELAAIITANRAGGTWWLPPAGFQSGRVPSFVIRQKILRKYNYADDQNSDIAKLYDANINPTRVNDQGQVIYGQKTMLKRSTALNRLNVIMLIAGIHKRFTDFLDRKVFQLNTPNLRSNIQSELQAQINAIKSANPAGLTDGKVICDDTNNTPQIIDTNQLIVDVRIQPTRSSEFITLRTTVIRTGEDINISSSIL
jgi:hypothetical protein